MVQKHNVYAWRKYYWVGLEFSITFIAVLCFGLWLDQRRGMTPAYTITFGVLGFAAAMYRLVRQAREIRKLSDDAHTDEHHEVD